MPLKNRAFKRYQQLDKFIFSELVVNFSHFQRNNSILKQKKRQLKTLDERKVHVINS